MIFNPKFSLSLENLQQMSKESDNLKTFRIHTKNNSKKLCNLANQLQYKNCKDYSMRKRIEMNNLGKILS